MSTVLIVVDYQNDFISGVLGHKDCLDIKNNICNIIKEHLEKKNPVVFTKDTHFDDYLETAEGKHIKIAHCIKGTEGHNLHKDIIPLSSESGCTVIEKNQFGLNNFDCFKNFGDIKEFIVVGVATNICVLSNVILLLNAYKDSKITVVENCCASYDKDLHVSSLKVMKALGVNVI